MTPHFTTNDILWILFMSSAQFILVPAFALGILIYAWRSRQPQTRALAAPFSILIFLIAAQVIELTTVLPWLDSIIRTSLRESGPPLSLAFVLGAGLAAAFLVIPALRKRSSIFIGICRIAAIISLALLLVTIYIMVRARG